MIARFAQRCGTALLIAALTGCGGGPSGPGGGQPASFGFEQRTDLSTAGTKPSSVVTGDFNGDGKPDIAVSNFSSNTIAVFLNEGRGTFGAPVMTTVNIPNGLGSIVSGDFNEDGKLDLMVATISGPQADIVLLGKGDGTFSQQSPVPSSFGYLAARVIDLNSDGHEDVVTVGNAFVTVLMGNGNGTFTANSLATPPGGAFPGAYLAVAVGDFNGDGKLDIVASELFNILVFYAGNGDGSFQAPTVASLLGGANSLASADFNGDGKVDALIGTSLSAYIAAGNGDGTFQLALGSPTFVYDSSDLPPASDGIAVQTADLNGDGKPDVIATDYATGILAVVLNGSFGEVPPSTGSYEFTLAPGLNDIATGDLNGDGLPDIVVSNGETNQISIFLSMK